jgi:carbon-monoxide dehydrogenase iron sulfur subunit
MVDKELKKVIFIDVEKCLACKSCELQCAIGHSASKNLFEAIKEEPLPKPRVKVEYIEKLTFPLQCRHCEDAPCVKICPTKALEQLAPHQPVIIKSELCIGCSWCIMVCPFGVIKFDSKGKAIIKCDLCIERLKMDKEPACVEGCPTKALKFLSIEEITEIKKGKFLVNFKEGKEES